MSSVHKIIIKNKENNKYYQNNPIYFNELLKLAERGKCSKSLISKCTASSKICSKCGYKKNDLKLSDRKWICLECGTEHIRDINAAINLKNNALSTLGSRGFQACGDSCQCQDQSCQITSMKQERQIAKSVKNGKHLQ